jgi:hypothetical protein
MIIETLKNLNKAEAINILYDLYRIFHKAEDGIYQTSFADSDLNEKESTTLQNILNNIDLKNHLGDMPFIAKAFSELNYFQDEILSKKLNIDKVAGAKKIDEILNPSPEIKKKKNYPLWLSLGACLVAITILTKMNIDKTDKINKLEIGRDKTPEQTQNSDTTHSIKYDTIIIPKHDTIFIPRDGTIPPCKPDTVKIIVKVPNGNPGGSKSIDSLIKLKETLDFQNKECKNKYEDLNKRYNELSSIKSNSNEIELKKCEEEKKNQKTIQTELEEKIKILDGTLDSIRNKLKSLKITIPGLRG